MEDLLNNPDLDIVSWVNQVLTNQTEINVTELQKQLQIVLHDANRNLDTSMQRVLHAVPLLDDELQKILLEGQGLSQCLSEINSRVETTYDHEPLDDTIITSTTDPLQKLLDLETVLGNMRATSEKLSHHALWNKTMRAARQRMYGEDILSAANLISQLQQTLIVLSELPGHEERSTALQSVSNEFDDSLRPGLLKALENKNVDRLRTYLDIFRNMNDVKGFEKLYVSARCALLSSKWNSKKNSKKNGNEETTKTQDKESCVNQNHNQNQRRRTEQTNYLKQCLLDVRDLIHTELKIHLPALFQQNQEDVTSSSSHVRMLQSMIEQGCRAMQLANENKEDTKEENNNNTINDINVTPDVVDLNQVLVWHGIVTSSLIEMYEEIRPSKSNESFNDQEVDVLATFIFHQYINVKYTTMEKKIMQQEMHQEYPCLYFKKDEEKKDINATVGLDQLHDVLQDNADACFTIFKAGIERCDVLSKGTNTMKLMEAMNYTLIDFHQRIQIILQNNSTIKKNSKQKSSMSPNNNNNNKDNKDNNNNNNNNSNSKKDAQEGDQVSISLRLILVLRTHLSNLIQYEKDISKQITQDMIRGTTTKTETTASTASTGTEIRATSTDVLAKAKEAASKSIQIAVRSAYDICMAPIVSVLTPLPSMEEIWSKTFDDDNQITGRDDFEIYGQLEYATYIGEYLIDLVQKLEPLEATLSKKNYLLNDINLLNVIEEEWDRTVVALKLETRHYLNNMGGPMEAGMSKKTSFLNFIQFILSSFLTHFLNTFYLFSLCVNRF